MASSSPKHFFLIALFIASLAHARESQFFSKATKETTTTQVVPIKEQQPQQETLYKQQDQQQVDEPNFIQDTNPNGYGLYGHETGQLPPSTTTTTSTIPEESLYSNDEQNNDNYEQYKSNGENRYYYNKDAYMTDEERAAALGNRYTATAATLGDRNTLYSGGNSYGNLKQEGMSDTRFMENGKYFYDIDNEEKYYPNYRYEDARMTASRSGEYNANMVNRGYNQNNYRNPKYEYSGNSMGGFGQNQEEFQEVQDEFVP